MTITTRAPHPGSLLKELDLDRTGFLYLIELASELKADRAAGTETAQLTGKNIALVFEHSSTRTRCAFEVAAHEQGASVTYLGGPGWQLGAEESIADAARVLGRLYHGIEFRGYAQATVEELARYAGVPVWNGLTDEWHPTQMLADVLTMLEHHTGPISEISLCFVGDARNNVARSLLITGALLGLDVRVCAPRRLWPPDEVVERAQELALGSGALVTLTEDLTTGVAGVEFVYTDVWVSLDETEEQWARRVALLAPYQVTERVLAMSGRPDVKFMHCLPAVHDAASALGNRLYQQFGLVGAEVSDEVFESDRSIVFDQAENRLHTVKAVLVSAFETG
ncbi:MAG TPA: ornithine carbamoyltransferase [Jatrophihabitans sp.]|nr:ornithine carbamoyltransferase [Jatrophihabitans sp.]